MKSELRPMVKVLGALLLVASFWSTFKSYLRSQKLCTRVLFHSSSSRSIQIMKKAALFIVCSLLGSLNAFPTSLHSASQFPLEGTDSPWYLTDEETVRELSNILKALELTNSGPELCMN